MTDENYTPRNTLDLSQHYKLRDWFGLNSEFLAGGPTYDEAARKATRDLGFHVSGGNVQGANAALGMAYTPSRTRSRQKNAAIRQAQVVAEVKKAVAPLEAKVAELEATLTKLCRELGASPPPGNAHLRTVPLANSK